MLHMHSESEFSELLYLAKMSLNLSVRFLFYVLIIFWTSQVSLSSDVPVLEHVPRPDMNGGSQSKFLLILLDGFRWNYLHKVNLTGFPKLRQGGVHAEYMLPIFPSVSYPNYYSIATGLYGESHGMIMNYMYDPEHDNVFDMGSPLNETYWWDDAEPVWITATKAGLKTYVYSWPGCEMLIRGTRPTYCYPYNEITVELFERQLGQALDNLASDTADFAIVYTEYTDEMGHTFGPNSNEMDAAVRKVDAVFDEMLQNITDLHLQNSLNLIIVSDHGMTATDDDSVEKISMKDYVNIDDVKYLLDRGTFSEVFPVETKMDSVYDSLKDIPGAHVWKKEDIPEYLHIKEHPRCPPILVLMKPGYYLTAYTQSKKQYPYISTAQDVDMYGEHGYDVSEMSDMRAIFLAWGTDIRQNVEANPIANIDVYNLAMHLLRLEPLPNNGTWDHVKDFLRQ